MNKENITQNQSIVTDVSLINKSSNQLMTSYLQNQDIPIKQKVTQKRRENSMSALTPITGIVGRQQPIKSAMGNGMKSGMSIGMIKTSAYEDSIDHDLDDEYLSQMIYDDIKKYPTRRKEQE